MNTHAFIRTETLDALCAAAGDLPTTLWLPFERTDIEAGQTGVALDRLLAISGSPNTVHHLASSVLLQIRGYDNDLRALFKINACQRFFREIAYAWDGWLYFLEKDGGSIPLFLSLLVEFDTQHNPNGTVSHRLHDPRELKEVLEQLFYGMNSLYERYRLLDSDCQAMTEKVFAAVERMLGLPGAG